MQKFSYLCGITVTVLVQSLAEAGVSFYAGNPTAFNTDAANLEFKGIEDWESSVLGASLISFLDDPLVPGMAKGTFPSGSNAAAGVSVQSNTLGGNAVNVSPRGSSGLATNSIGYFGAPSDQVGTNNFGDSLDLIINPSGNYTGAVSLNPLYYHGSATSSTSTLGNLTIKVYDNANTLLGTQTMTGVGYSSSDFLGIIATSGSNIRRINIASATDINNSATGVDNIRVFGGVTIPEPTVASFTLLGLVGLLRRRR